MSVHTYNPPLSCPDFSGQDTDCDKTAITGNNGIMNNTSDLGHNSKRNKVVSFDCEKIVTHASFAHTPPLFDAWSGV